jgi:hypothetical protein
MHWPIIVLYRLAETYRKMNTLSFNDVGLFFPFLASEPSNHDIVGLRPRHSSLAASSLARQTAAVQQIGSIIDDKTIHELYLTGFAEAVRAGVGSVMW